MIINLLDPRRAEKNFHLHIVGLKFQCWYAVLLLHFTDVSCVEMFVILQNKGKGPSYF